MSKRLAIIVDIDGTVADKGERGPFEWHRVGEDKPKHDVIEVVGRLVRSGDSPAVIFLSGRDEECWGATWDWLQRHVPFYFDTLRMRPHKDYRKDAIVKRELYEMYVAPFYDVLCVFDDRQQVVDMWRSLGLLCLQVAPGDF